MESTIRRHELVAYLLFMACVLTPVLVMAPTVPPSTAVEAAGTWQVPEGYSVRVYTQGDLTLVYVIQPPNETDAERELYAFWGIVHQAQARRLDAEVRDCYTVGDLTVECPKSLTTFGTERGNRSFGAVIPRRDGP